MLTKLAISFTILLGSFGAATAGGNPSPGTMSESATVMGPTISLSFSASQTQTQGVDITANADSIGINSLFVRNIVRNYDLAPSLSDLLSVEQ